MREKGERKVARCRACTGRGSGARGPLPTAARSMGGVVFISDVGRDAWLRKARITENKRT